jgi:enediyne biosynthesis protein E4
MTSLLPGTDWLQPDATTKPRARPPKARIALLITACAIGAGGTAVFLATGQVRRDHTPLTFRFEELAPAQTGIDFVHEKGAFAPFFDNVKPFMQAVSAGACAADVDNDGDVDLFFTNSGEGTKNALYRNDGAFKFTKVEAPALDGSNGRHGFSSDCVFGDVDNDGRVDVLLLAIAQPARLVRNTADGWLDVTEGAGLPAHMNGFAGVFVDIDRDADLDIVMASYWGERYREEDVPGAPLITNWDVPQGEGAGRMMPNNWGNATNGGTKYLLLNDGTGKFAPQDTKAWGWDELRFTFDIGTADVNLDGFTDVHFSNDFGPDQLYLNEGGKHFRLVKGTAPTSMGRDSFKGMNAELGDIDGDAYPEIFVTNVFHPVLPEGNLLWRNVDDGHGARTFINAAAELGVKDGGWGWGGKLVDLDLDGDKDLLQTNGYISQNPDREYWYRLSQLVSGDRRLIVDTTKWPAFEDRSMSGHQVSRVFVWEGSRTEGRFYDRASDAGLTKSVDGRGVLIADLDKDGRPDAIVVGQGVAPMVMRNAQASVGQASAPASWIGLVLRGDGAHVNRDAVGARVEVRAGDTKQFFEVSAGNGMSAQSSSWVHAGLGMYAGAIDVVVHWPDGTSTTRSLAPGAYHEVSR